MATDSDTRSDSVLQAHTPAPWEIDGEGLIFHRPDALTKYVIAQMESGVDANEKLILAAPDMKAALIAAKREMWMMARDQWTMADFKNWAVIQQIDAALDAARGVAK